MLSTFLVEDPYWEDQGSMAQHGYLRMFSSEGWVYRTRDIRIVVRTTVLGRDDPQVSGEPNLGKFKNMLS